MENSLSNDALEIPAGMKHYELPTREETLDLTGKLLYVVDNDQGGPRWAELKTYRILNTDPESDVFGQEMWLLYTIGHSMAYHAADGCNRGILLPVRDFPAQAEDPEGLEACPRCRPPQWDSAPDDLQLRLEVTWYKYVLCKTPDMLYNALCREPSCANCTHRRHQAYPCSCGCAEYEEAPRELSVPGRRMWEQLRRLDPDIAKAATRRRKF